MSDHLLMSGRVLELVAQRFKLLSEPSRLRLLELLLEGEKSVGELAQAMGTHQANISHQLGMLADGGLIMRRREGAHIIYRISDTSLTRLSELVCNSLQSQGEADLCLLKGERS